MKEFQEVLYSYPIDKERCFVMEKWIIIQKYHNHQDLIFELFLSAEYDNFEGVLLMVEYGADINAIDIIFIK